MNDNRATNDNRPTNDTTDDNARHAIEGPVLRLATAPRWLSGPKAAAVLGVSLRTLQRNASSGTVKRTVRGRCSLYLVSAPVLDATDDTTTRDTIGDIDTTDDNTRHERHDARQPDPTVIDLTVRLADAERRAAVAEYRAEIAETNPEVVEELRARVVQLEEHASNMEAERDMAHTQGQALADAMRKRHGLVW